MGHKKHVGKNNRLGSKKAWHKAQSRAITSQGAPIGPMDVKDDIVDGLYRDLQQVDRNLANLKAAKRRR